jgi:hypothetical protein
MLLRFVLVAILFIIIARTFWNTVDGLIEGLTGSPRSRQRRTGAGNTSVQMARDPVCGTFVVPERALSLGEGRAQLFFCSAACRDRYAAGAGRPERVEGRTA